MAPRKRAPNYSKNKGNTFERDIATLFQDLGYNAKTSRLSSKLLDNSSIDIIGTPFLVQCKSGYEKVQFTYAEEYEKAVKAITELFGEQDREKLLNLPHIFIHKRDKPKGIRARPKQYTTVTMSLTDFVRIIQNEDYKKNLLSILG